MGFATPVSPQLRPTGATSLDGTAQTFATEWQGHSDELTPRVFRALYPGHDLRTVAAAHVAVPKGTPWFAGTSLAEVAIQISRHTTNGEIGGGKTMGRHHDDQDIDRTAFAAAALDALRLLWGDGYEIGFDDEVWWYRRRDGKGGTQTAPDPDELNKMITDDHTFMPVRVTR
jgi:hypothetical protein